MAAPTCGAAGPAGGAQAAESAAEKRIILAAGGCATMAELRRLYGFLVRHHHRLRNPSLLLAKLIRFAAVSPYGDMRCASRLLFHGLHHGEIHAAGSAFFYNTLIRGLARRGDASSAVSLFKEMRRRSVPPDQFSFTFLLKARARYASQSPPAGQCGADVHALVLKHGCLTPSAPHVHNAIIHLYGVVGFPKDAAQMFEEMPEPDVVSWSSLLTAQLTAGDLVGARRIFDAMLVRDVVSWTAMISGYAQLGRPLQALSLFQSMPPDMQPDEVTLVGVVSACAATGDLETGAAIHRYADDKGLGWMTSLRNALIAMYAKCGCTESARKTFDETPRRNTVTWNSMISAYAVQGNAEAALRLLQQTPAPDGATFLAAMCACSHGGRVEEGRRVLESMEKRGVQPGVEHYGCVVDMLGRAGRLEEAYRLVSGAEGNHAVWGALLGGCRIHGDVELAEKAVAELMRLRPAEGGYYLLLAGVYAAVGRHGDADDIRRRMAEGGALKLTAHSTLRVFSPLHS